MSDKLKTLEEAFHNERRKMEEERQKALKNANASETGSFCPSKPVQTRDGRKARIVCQDYMPANGGPLILAIYTNPNGHESACRYFSDGRISRSAPMPADLINIPPKPVERWVNIYPYPHGYVYGGEMYGTEEAANRIASAGIGPFRTVKIELPPL